MGEEFGGGQEMGPCLCMAMSLHYSLETIIILLIGYTPIENLKFEFKKRTTKKVRLT